jgi:catechol 2,3-dioxygenase-like lactoylglutathione lyase family enzyme
MPAPVQPQPLIAVSNVRRAAGWYARVLGVAATHGGDEYEQLRTDGALILQLHARDVEHHHGAIGDPTAPAGNGVALWFELAAFDAAVERVRAVGATVVTDVHVNPNAHHREIWLRDPDGYLVVLAEAD